MGLVIGIGLLILFVSSVIYICVDSDNDEPWATPDETAGT